MMCLKLERNLWDWIMSNTFRHWASRSASAAPRSYLIPFIFGEAAPSLLQGTVSHIELRRQQRSEHDGDAAAAAAGIFGAGCAGGLRRHFRRLWQRSKAAAGIQSARGSPARPATPWPCCSRDIQLISQAQSEHSTTTVYVCMHACMYNITMNDIIYLYIYIYIYIYIIKDAEAGEKFSLSLSFTRLCNALSHLI